MSETGSDKSNYTQTQTSKKYLLQIKVTWRIRRQ